MRDMTQKQKELLLKDVSARIPYNLVVQIEGCGIWNLRGIDHDDSAILRDIVIVWHGKNYPSSKNSFPITNCKPFLFPLSSMTEEQEEEWDELFVHPLLERIHPHTRKDDLMLKSESSYAPIFWLIKNHFDYRGLIEKGLAIDATGLNIY